MKLPIKLAILAGTGGFVLATYTAVFKNVTPSHLDALMNGTINFMDYLQLSPFEILWSGLTCGLGAGVLGWFLGDTLAHPKGNAKKETKTQTVSPSYIDADDNLLSGSESFFGDLDDTPLPELISEDPTVASEEKV